MSRDSTESELTRDIEVLNVRQQASLLSVVDGQCWQLCQKNDKSSVLRKLKGLESLASHNVIKQIVAELENK